MVDRLSHENWSQGNSCEHKSFVVLGNCFPVCQDVSVSLSQNNTSEVVVRPSRGKNTESCIPRACSRTVEDNSSPYGHASVGAITSKSETESSIDCCWFWFIQKWPAYVASERLDEYAVQGILFEGSFIILVKALLSWRLSMFIKVLHSDERRS